MANTKLPPRKNVNRLNPFVLRTLTSFSPNKRNEIRGAMNLFQRDGYTTTLEKLVRGCELESDMRAAGALLEAPDGLKGRKVYGNRQIDIWNTYSTEKTSLHLELAYISGFLNSWEHHTLKAIETIRLLSLVGTVEFSDASGALLATAREWGASNYLSYKIAFLKSVNPTLVEQNKDLNEADKVLGHKESPAVQYSALENLKNSLSLFSVARRHTNSLRSKIGSDFRKYHSLSNIVSTPVSSSVAAGFLLRANETSLIDTVHALWVLLNLKSRFPDAQNILERNLNSEIYETLIEAHQDVATLDPPELVGLEEPKGKQDTEASLELYRKSSAFLEHPSLCQYRNDLDCVIGLRLVSSIHSERGDWPAEEFDDLNTLKRENATFSLSFHEHNGPNIDSFYRTYLFLRFIQNPLNLSLMSEEDIKFVFNNTVELDSLLLEREMQSMHLTASNETQALVSVLALALYRGRSSDPDIDFQYRLKLEQYIKSAFGGDIAKFIHSLTETCPQIANYLAYSLDEATLQKMYALVNSSQQSSTVRRDILNSVGFALNRIDYIIEAEAIETRTKVAGLKKYFDTSRMFVDSVAMRDWLASNPSAYTQQYKELLPKLVARLAAVANVEDKKTGEKRSIPFVELSSPVDHLVKEISIEAFREFCTNAEFGIESYLGRRIRHNTLEGVMTDAVDSVINKYSYPSILTGTRFGSSIDGWLRQYRNYIERMKKEFLRFKDTTLPNALFEAELDFQDSATRRAVTNLSASLQASGPEMLPDLVIAFCWQQIGPQLDAASRQIKVKMASDIKSSLEQSLGGYHGIEERRLYLELVSAVEEVFSKIASWFRLPETGFVPATITGLCQIIDIEFNREELPTIVKGNALETQYYGISVHRLYDCLAVLIQNAIKHGELMSDISVLVDSNEIPGTNLHRVCVSVQSRIDEEEFETSIERINSAIASTETGKDMITEGYSGIKKLKYITKLNEGRHTVEMTNVGNELEIRFSLKVELAKEQQYEENSAD